MRIELGYTPDADDAYMLFGLLNGAIELGDWRIEPVEANLQTLNDRASRGELPATMISAAVYPLVREHYIILQAGASFGLGCGPVVISRDAMDESDLPGKKIAIPGATTTAYAMLQLYGPSLQTRILPFEKLLPAVETGLVDCALVIHEEFVTYSKMGLQVVLDLGKWWARTHGDLPTPVTFCVVRKDMPPDARQRLGGLLRESVRYSLSHHAEAMQYAVQYANGAEPVAVDKFVRQYVNDLSVDMGPRGRQSLEAFFDQATRANILPPAGPLEIV